MNYYLASDYHFMKTVVASNLKGLRLKFVLSEFMLRRESLSSKYSNDMKSEVIQIKKELKIKAIPVVDFIFNAYRKIYNFHTFLAKRH